MRRQFKQLSKTQRNQLEMLLKAKVSKKEIAEFLGVHISTIYREIKRGEYFYLPFVAEGKFTVSSDTEATFIECLPSKQI
jgi:IS30 family transposase